MYGLFRLLVPILLFVGSSYHAALANVYTATSNTGLNWTVSTAEVAKGGGTFGTNASGVFDVAAYVKSFGGSGAPQAYNATIKVAATGSEVAAMGARFMRAATPVGLALTAAFTAADWYLGQDASGNPVPMQNGTVYDCGVVPLLTWGGFAGTQYSCGATGAQQAAQSQADAYFKQYGWNTNSDCHVTGTLSDGTPRTYTCTGVVPANGNTTSTTITASVSLSPNNKATTPATVADPVKVGQLYDQYAPQIAQEALDNGTNAPDWTEPDVAGQALADTLAGTTPPPSDPTTDPRNAIKGQSTAQDWPTFCGWAGVVCDAIDWMRQPAPQTDPVPALPVQDVSANTVTWSSGVDNGTCPAAVNFTVMGKTGSISFDPLCQEANWLRPLLLLLAAIQAAYILAGLRSISA